MKNKMILLLCLLLIPSFVLAEVSCTDDSAKIKALETVADAFYYRGGNLQYDDVSMLFNSSSNKLYRKRRSSVTQTPEEATPQDMRYTVCSAFVVNTYYEAFTKDGKGYELKKGNGGDIGLAEHSSVLKLANKDNSDWFNAPIAVIYINNNANKYYFYTDVNGTLDTTVDNTNYVEKFKEYLRPGDIIAYNHGGSDGHAMLYLGGDVIINSTATTRNETYYTGSYTGKGGSYNYKDKKENQDPWGTVGYLSLENDIYNYTDKYSKYIFDTGSNVSTIGEIAVIRPFNELTVDNISEKTCNRMQHSELVRTKTASVEKYETVNVGDTIKYIITLENKSSENYNNLVITDVVPSNSEFVSFDGDVKGEKSGSNLTWTVSVPANSKKVVTYTVKALKEGIIVNDKTVADGVILNTIKTRVATTLCDSYKTNITNIIKDNENKYEDMSDLLKDVYPDLNIPSSVDAFSVYYAKQEEGKETEYFDKYGYNFTATIPANNTTFGHTHETGVKKLSILKNASEVDEQNRNMYVDGLFGGVFAKTQSDTPTNIIYEDGRNLTWTNKTFMIGDILYIYDENYKDDSYMFFSTCDESTSACGYNSYLYVDDNTFATVYNGKLKVLSKDESTRLIESIVGQNAFIAIRPSHIATCKVVEIPVEDNKATEPIENPKTGFVIPIVAFSMITIIGISLYLVNRKKEIIKKI